MTPEQQLKACETESAALLVAMETARITLTKALDRYSTRYSDRVAAIEAESESESQSHAGPTGVGGFERSWRGRLERR